MIDKDTIKLLMKKDSALNIILQSIQLKYINLSSGDKVKIQKKIKSLFLTKVNILSLKAKMASPVIIHYFVILLYIII